MAEEQKAPSLADDLAYIGRGIYDTIYSTYTSTLKLFNLPTHVHKHCINKDLDDTVEKLYDPAKTYESKSTEDLGKIAGYAGGGLLWYLGLPVTALFTGIAYLANLSLPRKEEAKPKEEPKQQPMRMTPEMLQALQGAA